MIKIKRILAAGAALLFSAVLAIAANLQVDRIITGATPPVLTTCGTSPAIVGSDTAGLVTMGTGSPTGCVITFALAYAAVPHCVVTWQTNIASMQYTTTATAITLVQTGTSSNLVNYTCISRAGG